MVVDYAAGDYLDGSVRYDLLIDIGGRNPLRALRKALTKRGTLVIVGGKGGDKLTGGMRRRLGALALSPFVSQRLTMFISTEHYRYIEQLAGFIERGEVTPSVGCATNSTRCPRPSTTCWLDGPRASRSSPSAEVA